MKCFLWTAKLSSFLAGALCFSLSLLFLADLQKLKGMDLLLAILMWSPLGTTDFNIQSLPPLMVQASGQAVATKQDWQQRRESIQFQLQDLVYGFLPKKNPPMTIEALNQFPLKSGLGIVRDVRLKFPSLQKEIVLAVFVSNKNAKDSKTFLVLNKCGNHTVLDDLAIAESGLAWSHPVHCFENKSRLGRGAHEENYAITDILKRGHHVVTWSESDVAADTSPTEKVGVTRFMEPTHADSKKTWGVLMAWAWGYMRAMDYVESAKDLNPKRVVAVGHSRRGKAALLAAAFDERIPAVVPHQSGTGGTALMRGSEKRETPDMMTKGWIGYPFIGEPRGLKHFFSEAFGKISADVNSLPFDSHFLISLVAPRVLVDFQGKDDLWAGPASATIALQAAAPAWTLTAGNDSNLAQAIVSGGHRLTKLHWLLIMDIVDTKMK